MKRPEQKLINFLKNHQLTIAFAESMTCGRAASRMGNVSGTSEAFAGSIVCYDKSVKTGLLGIPATLIKKHSAESSQVTDALCKKLKRKIQADIYAAVTGLAAPGGSESKQKPVGTVFISVSFRRKLLRIKKKFNGSPKEIKDRACSELFNFTLKVLKQTYRK